MRCGVKEIPLAIPKRTKQFVEIAHREREQGASMHNVFQRDLACLKLDTVKAYSKALNLRCIANNNVESDRSLSVVSL